MNRLQFSILSGLLLYPCLLLALPDDLEQDLLTSCPAGAPATFQQQPALDQEIVYANGERIVFNGSEQIITIEGEASFTQEGTIDTTAARIEYDIPNRKLDATQMNMVIPSQSQP